MANYFTGYPVSERTPGFIPPARTEQGFQMGLGRATSPPALQPRSMANPDAQPRQMTPEEWAVGKTNLEIGLHVTRDLGGFENMTPQEAQTWRRLFANAPPADEATWRRIFPNTPPMPSGGVGGGQRAGETNADWAARLGLTVDPKAARTVKALRGGM